MFQELSVFEIKGLENLSDKFVTLVPFTLGEETSFKNTAVNIGDDLKNYHQQQPRDRFRKRLNDIQFMQNDRGGTNTEDKIGAHPEPEASSSPAPATNESTTESSLDPGKTRLGTSRKIKKNKKMNLVNDTKESRSIIKQLPQIMEDRFSNFVETLRYLKNRVKIYLKRKKRVNYIILSKINNSKIRLLKFVTLLFTNRRKIKKHLNEETMSDLINFCKQLPDVAKKLLGKGISKLL